MFRSVHPDPDAATWAKAPKQQDMLLDLRPDKRPVDWKSVQKSAVMPLIYDPPQLQPGWMGCAHRYCCFLNWYMHKTPLFTRPCMPCCCASCMLCCSSRCCGRSTEQQLISDPDDWFEKLLKTGSHPNCPEHLAGLWWMQDNHAHECLATFHDMDWRSSKLGRKRLAYNWTRPKSCVGVLSYAAHLCLGTELRLEISPNGKWMNMAFPCGEFWAYIVQEGDAFVDPEGDLLPMEPGEFFRINYKEPGNVQSEMEYLYRVRRIAYLDAEGNLVRTRAYRELLKRVREKTPRTSPCCGNYFVCIPSEQAALRNWLQLADRQFFSLAPSAAEARG